MKRLLICICLIFLAISKVNCQAESTTAKVAGKTTAAAAAGEATKSPGDKPKGENDGKDETTKSPKNSTEGVETTTCSSKRPHKKPSSQCDTVIKIQNQMCKSFEKPVTPFISFLPLDPCKAIKKYLSEFCKDFIENAPIPIFDAFDDDSDKDDSNKPDNKDEDRHLGQHHNKKLQHHGKKSEHHSKKLEHHSKKLEHHNRKFHHGKALHHQHQHEEKNAEHHHVKDN